MKAQLGLGVFMLIAGAYILTGVPRHHGVREGLGLGFGGSAAVIGVGLLGLARLTRRHLDEPAAYWQQLQDRWRPVILRTQAFGGAALTVLGVFGLIAGFDVAGGALLATGFVPLVISVLMVTGGIKPIQYE